MSKARAVRLELRRGRAPDSRVQFDDEGDGVRFGWFVVVGRHVNVFECWRNSAGCEPRLPRSSHPDPPKGPSGRRHDTRELQPPHGTRWTIKP